MQIVRVQVKNVYGNEVYYPACPAAQLFADVAGTKTITENTLRILKRNGYEVIVQNTAYAFA
jgi:hypothetical protein